MWVADGDHQLPHAQPFGLAQRGRVERHALDAQHRQVAERISAHHLETLVAAVGERGAPGSRVPADDMSRGQQIAVRRERHGAARAGRKLAAPDAPHHPQACDRRADALGHRDDRSRVRIERLGLAGPHRWLVLEKRAHAAAASVVNCAVTVRSSVPRTTVRSIVSPGETSSSTS